jgi:zinc protease
MKASILVSRGLFPGLLLVLVACGETAPPPKLPVVPPPTTAKVDTNPVTLETPDAPFRGQAPGKAEGSRPFVAPKVQELTLKNGIRVLFAPHPVQTVSVSLVVRAGQGDVKGAKAGALSFLGAMLEQGTKTRTALKLSDDFEAIGAHHDASFGWDSGALSVDVLREHLDAALELLADVATQPTFPKDEVERLRTRRLANLQAEKNNPSAMMGNAQAAVLFGRAHPYGHALSGEEADVRAISQGDLVKLHKELFVPSLMTIVVSGGVNDTTLVPALERTFGTMKGPKRDRGAAPLAPVAPKTKDEARLVLVDKPRAAQSQICVTQVGVAANTEDRDAISVMNAILGGMFSSRINLNLREKHAYTYGARSYFSMRRGPGPFAASAAVVTDKTAPALHEIFVEIEKMRDREVSESELSGAKEGLVQTLPARFETARDVVNALSDVVVYDWPADEYATRVERISKVTDKDVLRVAQKFLTPRSMKVVVVGDRQKLETDLEAMHLGAPDVRDAYGNKVDEKKAATSAPAAKPLQAVPAKKKP